MSQSPILTVKDWQNGIGDSPHLGHALLQNVEIDTETGAARVGKMPQFAFHTTTIDVFTADSTTDIMTVISGTGNVPATGTAITVSNSGGSLPGGLSASTNYFIIKLSPTTFSLATTLANAFAPTAIDITNNGSGTNTFTTVDPGTVNHYAVDPRSGVTFCIDSNGRVWFLGNGASTFQLLNGNSLTSPAGQGLAVFRVSDGSATYLFAFRNAAIDVVNVFGTSQLQNPSWTNGWKSMNSGAGSGNSHHAILGQDNIIYFCDDRYIGSILEKAGQVFDPSNSATYTYNNQALDLPLGSLTYWLEQLGINLLISVSNDAYIYPWDRSSDSYGLPLPIGEYGGNKMKNIGNIIYILVGTRGNIYWTQGTYVRPFKTVPYYLANNASLTPIPNPVLWGGIAGSNGKLLFGVGANSGNSGVYMLDAQGHLTVDNFPSQGQQRVTAIYASNDFYQMGFAGGSDIMQNARYSSLGSVILQSPFYRIGNTTEKATISQIEYQIASGQSGSIRLGYRTDITASFTNIPNPSGSTTTWATSSSATSDSNDCGLINLENIQFQVELSGNLDFMELRAYA